MSEEHIQQIIHAIEKHTSHAVEKTVNGKIRAIEKKIDDHIHEEYQWKQNDKEWKDSIQPVIDGLIIINKGGNFVVWVSKVILALGVVIGALMAYRKY